MSSILPSQKMADTSKDELLLDGGINCITTTSRRSKQVPACVSNIVKRVNFRQYFDCLRERIFSCCNVLMSSYSCLKFAIELHSGLFPRYYLSTDAIIWDDSAFGSEYASRCSDVCTRWLLNTCLSTYYQPVSGDTFCQMCGGCA